MKDLDQWLQDISVMDPEQWWNDDGPEGWYAVSHPAYGIVAYFKIASDAYRYRLDMINRILNP